MSVHYDPELRTLFTVPEHFAQRNTAARIRWEPVSRVGNSIRTGMILGHIHYNDGETEPIKAPAGCSGTIARRNVRIAHHDLHVEAQRLLVLT